MGKGKGRKRRNRNRDNGDSGDSDITDVITKSQKFNDSSEEFVSGEDDVAGCEEANRSTEKDRLIQNSTEIQKKANELQEGADNKLESQPVDFVKPSTPTLLNDGKSSDTTEKELSYNSRDNGPFVVILQRQDVDLFKTAQHIRSLLGKENIEIIRKIAPDRLRIQTKNYKSANQILQKHGSTDTRTFIPPFHLSSVGVVDNIPIDFTLEEMKQECETPHQIIKIERMLKMDKGCLIPIDKVKIEFRTFLVPREIKIFGAAFRVRLFVPKPTFCRRCLCYGHREKKCLNLERCLTCTLEINGPHDNCNKFCKFCETAKHTTNHKDCPENVYQFRIRKRMVEGGRTNFKEAKTWVYSKKYCTFHHSLRCRKVQRTVKFAIAC
ncbi:hypothetical protein DMENIID0001_118590 [Sergentomyia squamirostris]